jgi:YVTN family beta-propeller protein
VITARKAAFILAALVAAGCGPAATPQTPTPSPTAFATPTPTATPTPQPTAAPPFNVYAGTMQGLDPRVIGIPVRVYVPATGANTVTEIDPETFQVIRRFAAGATPEHITPSFDLSTLYVDEERSGQLLKIDPRTGLAGGTVQVNNPYNLYFTPDGKAAIVVEEYLRNLAFYDASTWALIRKVHVDIPGIDHMDFSVDGSYFLISAEFSGAVIKFDSATGKQLGIATVGGLPIDVKLSPDGTVFYVANQGRSGVSVIDPMTMHEVTFIPTERGAHGLYISRDTRSLYVSNRLAGSVSVIDFATRKVTATWHVGGSPDMLQLNWGGNQLWASSRFDGNVMVIDTKTGQVLKRIFCGAGAHGLTFFPAPGRISLGHNGVYR